MAENDSTFLFIQQLCKSLVMSHLFKTFIEQWIRSPVMIPKDQMQLPIQGIQQLFCSFPVAVSQIPDQVPQYIDVIFRSHFLVPAFSDSLMHFFNILKRTVIEIAAHSCYIFMKKV